MRLYEVQIYWREAPIDGEGAVSRYSRVTNLIEGPAWTQFTSSLGTRIIINMQAIQAMQIKEVA